MILFLDDDPNRAALAYQRMNEEDRNNTIWCQTAEEAIYTLKDYKEVLTQVYLDHDLGGQTYVHSAREDCGMEVIRFIEKLSAEDLAYFNGTKFVVHTWNESAGPKMVERLHKLGLGAEYKPFGM